MRRLIITTLSFVLFIFVNQYSYAQCCNCTDQEYPAGGGAYFDLTNLNPAVPDTVLSCMHPGSFAYFKCNRGDAFSISVCGNPGLSFTPRLIMYEGTCSCDAPYYDSWEYEDSCSISVKAQCLPEDSLFFTILLTDDGCNDYITDCVSLEVTLENCCNCCRDNPDYSPVFDDDFGSYCEGDTIPDLPTVSNDGISGFWTPEINNMATTTYTFHPYACVATVSRTIPVSSPESPIFDPVETYCEGNVIPELPTTSVDGISGSWSPAIDNTTTTTYTFTPDPGQCAIPATLTITVTPPSVNPVFNPVEEYCEGDVIPGLPTTSVDGISGSWSPAIDNTTTTTYTFTPDSGQCATTTDLTITINSLTVNAVVDNVSCIGGSDGNAIATVQGGDGNYTYLWSNGQTTDTASGLAAGICSVTVSDGNGCVSESEFIIGEPQEIIVVGMDNRQICIGGTANITISTTGGVYPYLYHWVGSDGFEWFGQNLSVSPDTTTSYTLYVTDNNGCIHEENATVYVHPPLELLSAFVDQDSVCPGEAVTLYAQTDGGNGGSYELTFDGHIVGLPYEFYPATSGWHYLVLSDACETPSVEDSVYVHIYDLPGNNFVSDIVGGCPPLLVQFTETNPDNGYSYSWYFGDGGFAYGQQTYHIYQNSGFYDVQLAVKDGNGCSRHKTIEDMIHAYPVPDIDFYTHPNDLSMLNPRVEFFPVTSYTDNLYWYFGDGDSSEGSHWNPVHTYNGVGEFEVMVIGTNHFECSDTSRKILNVREQFSFYAPTAFTPNYDGNNDCFSVCGKGIDPKEFSLVIYDRWGSIVFEAKEYDSRYGCDGCGDSSWDGSMSGDVSKGDRLLPTGVYSWICVYKDLFGVEHSEQGVIRLVR